MQGGLLFETEFSPEVIAEFERMGAEVSIISPAQPRFGHLGLTQIYTTKTTPGLFGEDDRTPSQGDDHELSQTSRSNNSMMIRPKPRPKPAPNKEVKSLKQQEREEANRMRDSKERAKRSEEMRKTEKAWWKSKEEPTEDQLPSKSLGKRKIHCVRNKSSIDDCLSLKKVKTESSDGESDSNLITSEQIYAETLKQETVYGSGEETEEDDSVWDDEQERMKMAALALGGMQDRSEESQREGLYLNRVIER